TRRRTSSGAIRRSRRCSSATSTRSCRWNRRAADAAAHMRPSAACATAAPPRRPHAGWGLVPRREFYSSRGGCLAAGRPVGRLLAEAERDAELDRVVAGAQRAAQVESEDELRVAAEAVVEEVPLHARVAVEPEAVVLVVVLRDAGGELDAGVR